MWVKRDYIAASEILRPAQGKQDGKERRAKKRKTTNDRRIVRKCKGRQRPIDENKAFLNWFTASPITSNPCTLSTQAHVSLQNLSPPMAGPLPPTVHCQSRFLLNATQSRTPTSKTAPYAAEPSNSPTPDHAPMCSQPLHSTKPHPETKSAQTRQMTGRWQNAKKTLSLTQNAVSKCCI